MESMRRLLRWATLLISVSLGPAGCVGIVDLDLDGSGRREATHTFHRVVPIDAQTALVVAGQNGAIRVEGVAGADHVTIHAVRRVRAATISDAEDHLPLLEVRVETQESKVTVRTLQPNHTGGRDYIVDYEILIPAAWCVALSNGNGTVTVDDLVGNVHVQNGNGNVVIDHVVGSSRVTLGNGEIDADVELPADGVVAYSVGNGSIRLTVPADVSAHFGATVGNGSITLTGLTLRHSVSRPGSLQGVLGNGDAAIGLSVGNGRVEVRGK